MRYSYILQLKPDQMQYYDYSIFVIYEYEFWYNGDTSLVVLHVFLFLAFKLLLILLLAYVGYFVSDFS